MKSDDSSGETGVEAKQPKAKGKGKGKKGKKTKKQETYENEPIVDRRDDDDDPDDIEEDESASGVVGASGSKETPKKRPSTHVAKKPAAKHRKHDEDWIELN